MSNRPFADLLGNTGLTLSGKTLGVLESGVLIKIANLPIGVQVRPRDLIIDCVKGTDIKLSDSDLAILGTALANWFKRSGAIPEQRATPAGIDIESLEEGTSKEELMATPFVQTPGETGGSEEIKSPDLLARLLAQRTPSQCPPVPGDWRKRPSWLSVALGQAAFGQSLPPWGSFADARLLIAYGHVAEGRELLVRLMGHSEGSPEYKTYRMAYCLEGLRPPDGIKTERLIDSLPPCEREALASLIAWDASDAQKGPESLMKSGENEVASDHGAFIVLLAWLAWSDVWLQTQILYPLGRTVEFGLAVTPNKGHAQLMLRRHEEAWETFSRGGANPAQTVDVYRKQLAVSLDEHTERRLTDMIQAYCLTGKALVLYDLCFATEAGRLFGFLHVSTPSTIFERACERLSRSG